VKNSLIRISVLLLALWVFTSGLHNVNWVYRSAYIASTVVFLLVVWVGKQKFGIDKILYVKAYIFIGWLVVSVAIALIVGWDNYQPIANGSLFGIVFGMFFYSKEFWNKN